MGIEFGMSSEVIGGRDVGVLTTGDGMTQFCDVQYEDCMGLSFVYGVGDGTIGKLTVHDEPKTLDEVGSEFVVKFYKPESIDSLIDQLQYIKEKLVAMLAAGGDA